MILLPYERPGSVGDLLATGLNRLGATPVRYGPVRDPEDALAVIEAEHVDVLVGAPAQHSGPGALLGAGTKPAGQNRARYYYPLTTSRMRL